jgi:hypothetical protein
MARLDAADGMVVLAGGPGAGKSTLLDAWVAARGGVLVGLDEQAPREWAGVLALDGITAEDGPALAGLARRPGVVVAADEDPAVEGAAVIGARDLAFAEDETYQVLAGAFGDAKAADAIAPDVHLLTNGWPALVGLAGVWLAQHPADERRDRLRALARVEADLAEYLVPAVLTGLDEADRELVRRLARLPDADARLADRLDITEHLTAVAPFVQPLARKPGWYAVPDGWRAAIARVLPMPDAEAAALRAAYAAGG